MKNKSCLNPHWVLGITVAVILAWLTVPVLLKNNKVAVQKPVSNIGFDANPLWNGEFSVGDDVYNATVRAVRTHSSESFRRVYLRTKDGTGEITGIYSRSEKDGRYEWKVSHWGNFTPEQISSATQAMPDVESKIKNDAHLVKFSMPEKFPGNELPREGQ